MSFELKTTNQTQLEPATPDKKLNRLIDEIEQQKLDLAKWQQAQEQIQQQVRLKLLPIYSELHQTLFQQLEQLWDNVQNPEFSKAEQLQLDDKTAQLAKLLRHSKSLNKQQIESVQKIDEFYRQLNRQKTPPKTQQNHQTRTLHESSETQTDQFEYEEWDSEKFQQQREQAMLKKQLEKCEQAAKMAEQSLKTVYLKITAMIHPDREPDEAKKEEKRKNSITANRESCL